MVGVLLLGLVGIVGAAPASAATRGFFIVNNTQRELTLLKAVNSADAAFTRCYGGDEYSPVGTKVAPGGTYRYEKVWTFNATCKAVLTFGYVDEKGAEQTFRVELMVLGFGEKLANAQSHPHIAVADTAGTNGTLTLTDK
jgi:hypothetical protein